MYSYWLKKRDPVAHRGKKPRVPIGTHPPTAKFGLMSWLPLAASVIFFNGYAISVHAAPTNQNAVESSCKHNAAMKSWCQTGGTTPDNGSTSKLLVEPTSHYFGEVTIDSSSQEKTFTLINEGDNPLQIGLLDVFGNVTTTYDELGNVTTAFGYQLIDESDNPTTISEFNLTEDACSNSELGVIPSDSAKCQFAMVFEPKEIGTKELELSIPYTDEFGNPNSLSLPLIGVGVDMPIPDIGASITSQNFGEIEIGSASDKQTIRIFNSGDGDLNIGEVKLEGNDAGDFGFFDGSCANNFISPEQFCSVKAWFAPQAEGEKTATISIASDDPDTPIFEISLIGKGIVPPVPDIKIEPTSLGFGEIQVGRVSRYQSLFVKNIGDAPLKIGQLSSLAGTEFERLADVVSYFPDLCSNRTINPSKSCIINIRLNPQSVGTKTAAISIPSNDPDTPTMDVSLTGIGVGWCQGDYEQYFNNWPKIPDFGTELVGSSTWMYQSVYSRARGCDALQIDTVTINGNDSDEFEIVDKQCYHGTWLDWSYSSCWFKSVFTPTEVGTKDAELLVTFTDTTAATPIPVQAEAVDPPGQPNLEVSPSSHDFGTSMVGTYGGYQLFTITNTGDVNLHFDAIDVNGANADDFQGHQWSWCSYKGVLYPSEQCWISLYFTPTSAGNKQANLTITSNALTVEVPLTGTATVPTNCDDENITIESSGNHGDDDMWATEMSGGYTGDSDAWNRLQNPYNDDTPVPNKPVADDVVRINSGHTIVGIPFAKVKTLCIEANGKLESLDREGTPLEIQAADYIQNKGQIIGLHGIDEMPGETSCDNPDAIGSRKCANPGASILLKVGQNFQQHGKLGDWWWYGSGGPILNEGEIIAGNGGKGTQYGAPGGDAIVLGRNTTNRGTIQAGHGGDMTGSAPGKGGRGGLTQIWGKLGGPGHLYNTNGAIAAAGNGGNCDPGGGSNQIGGRGGNLWLVSLPNVHLSGGIHKAGNGGNVNCSQNGEDGWVRIEPINIDLSGANTKVEGGNIEIFCGKDCNLDLSNISDTAITATGNITLAVGEGGSINMTGSTDILKAGGQVNVFADSILLDDGVKLADIVEATDVVVARGKILRDVSIVGPGSLKGNPGDTLPVNLTLTNNGAELDTYNLSVTDTTGWTLGQLPTSIEVKELESVELKLNVTLPMTANATNTIRVTAISQNDPEAREVAEIQVTVNDSGSATINQGLVNVPGVNANVEGSDVTISTGPGGKIDFSNLDGDKVVSTTGDITLAVGKDGVIDLRGNNAAILETDGQVVIYADKANILLDPGVKLEDIIKASNIVLNPSKPSYGISVTTKSNTMSKPTGSVLPLRFKLVNTGVETDSYTISVTDSAGWPLTKLPASKTIKGLDSTELLLNAGVLSSVGTTNVITVTATSQSQPSVTASAEVRINVTSATVSGTVVSGGTITVVGGCSTAGGVINRLCSNGGRELRDVTIGPDGAISGGILGGNIKSQGIISQATIEAEAVLTGGKVSGYVTNNGMLVDTEFVGAEIKGGTLSGTTYNNSEVGGVIRNVHLAKGASIIGGIVAGEISGDQEGPATLINVKVRPGTKLSHVILGEGVELGEGVILGEGVTCEEGVSTACGSETPEPEIELPMLPEELLSAINELPLFTDNDWEVEQDDNSGYLELTVDVVHFAILPTSVTETTEPADLVLHDAQNLSFITHSGFDVFAQPALQAPGALQSGLADLGLPEFTIEDNGNLHIPGEDGLWFSARPDWLAIEVESDAGMGLFLGESPVVSGYFSASLVFEHEGIRREQLLYSAIAYPDVLEDVITEPFGVVTFTLDGETYRGVVDYTVIPSDSTPDTLQVEPIPDANGDGIEDVVLIYPQGDQQIMFVVE